MPKQTAKPSSSPDAPPSRPIPWLWLAVAVVGGGLAGWVLANANFSAKNSAPPPGESKQAPSLLAALSHAPAPKPAPASFVPGLTPAQSNAIAKITNAAAPPPLLTAQTPPVVTPPVPAPRLGETLYNGIVLPEVWPPKGEYKPGEPMPVPYLSNPPPVIDITSGRQLFVDDFLVESNSLKRVWHPATLYSNNPVLKPDREWERAGNSPMAMPFSDGVWMDSWLLPVPTNITVADLENVSLLARRLKEGTNNIEKFLWSKLTPASQTNLAALAATNPPPDALPVKTALAAELTQWLNGPSLFEAARFAGVALGEQTQAWLAQNPQGGELVRLNRLLLGDVFAREFPRRPQLMRAWYMAGYGRGTALAVSEDGVNWEKPDFGVVPGSNVVQTDPRDSSTVWLDASDPNPRQRYKMWRSHGENKQFGLSLHFSEDGIHWGPRVLRTGSAGDRSTVFWNPFRKVWVYSLRHGWGEPRARRYWEVKDLLAGPQWKEIGEPQMWVGADRLDPMRADLQVAPQLYNLDTTPYESLMVGLFTIWRGDKNIPEGRPKPNSIWLGFSRDGYHWDRPDRRPFLDVSEKKGDWNWGNVQSTAGGFLVVGRNLWFYFSGRAGAADKRDADGATGLAFLRRDGFASMDAGPDGGVLTTRPVKFNARYMFVNMKTNTPDGELRIEILHADGRPIEMTKNDTKERVVPFTKENSFPMSGDQTLMGVSWKNGVQDLSMLAGRMVKFRFHLKNASLYSFWVGPGQLGRSMGHVAAGGPHFTGPTDTIGNKSYGAFPVPKPASAVAAPTAPTNAPAPAKPPEKK